MSERVPPRWVRRLIIDPIRFAVALLGIALSPVVLLIAAIADVFLPGRFRTTRLLAVLVVFLVCEVIGMTVGSLLWLFSGFGLGLGTQAFQNAHHRFIAWWLERLVGAAEKLLGLRIELEDVPAPKPGAVLVFPRHAGPGDSLLIARTLMSGYKRRPRIVMKATMQWAPTIDIIGNRLHACFIRPSDRDASRFIARIADLAKDMDEQEAVVLFPEGGNFTLRRRERAIAKLRESGREDYAARAEQMTHILAPRPGGALAAITAAPEADVVFVAHTGLEYLSDTPDLWRSVPLQQPIIGRYWRISPSEIPDGRDERIDWLYSWWSTIDAWIESHAAMYR
ncbi:MAG TPA: 1-acyl-sn-glycerol-3-phosphate acyltransferase [Actinomycetota bacterium]|nr:1-acyl-sn-glycerol-3-phosphate acyltransferase [Actinomycetota bacterium]